MRVGRKEMGGSEDWRNDSCAVGLLKVSLVGGLAVYGGFVQM